MAHHNYLIGHNTSPDRNKTNPSRLTALTPQNQPERPLLRGNQHYLVNVCPAGTGTGAVSLSDLVAFGSECQV